MFAARDTDDVADSTDADKSDTVPESVDDDGARGIVTIGAVEAWRMEEAKMAILNIADPPKAELDKVYMGRVVNITKFGAFVNILPGRDGLVQGQRRRTSRELELEAENEELKAALGEAHVQLRVWTVALEAGVPMKVVQDRLNHASERITADIYTHVRAPLQSDATERVAERILPDAPGLDI